MQNKHINNLSLVNITSIFNRIVKQKKNKRSINKKRSTNVDFETNNLNNVKIKKITSKETYGCSSKEKEKSKKAFT